MAKATYGQKWGQRKGPMDKRWEALSPSREGGRPLFMTRCGQRAALRVT